VIATEKHVYTGEPDSNVTTTTTVPLVATETRKVALESEDGNYSATGEIVSTQTISSKTRTVETITVSILCTLSGNRYNIYILFPIILIATYFVTVQN